MLIFLLFRYCLPTGFPITEATYRLLLFGNKFFDNFQRLFSDDVIVGRDGSGDNSLSQPDTSTPLGIRDKALLELLYSSAPTRTETEKLLLSHLDLEEGFLSIKARHNQKGRLIPLTDRAVKWLKIYLSESRPQLSNEGSPQALFLTKEGNALRGAHLGYIVSQNINLADTDKKGSFGLFRHTLAALMLEKGADIRFIQELLGHRSLESTRLYTKVSIRKLKEVHTKTHPGNRG